MIDNLRKIKLMKSFHKDEKKFCEKCDHTGRIFFIDKDSEISQKNCECHIKFLNNEFYKKRIVLGRIPTIAIDFEVSNYMNTGSSDTEKLINSKSIDEIRKISEDIPQFVKDARNLILLGPSGTGKTIISCFIAKKIIQSGMNAAYIDFPSFFIIAQKFDQDEIEKDWIDYVNWCQFLIIDSVDRIAQRELGKIYVLDSLLRNRIQSKKNTCLISSTPVEELESRVGFSCSSLIKERTKILPFLGNDFRKIK